VQPAPVTTTQAPAAASSASVALTVNSLTYTARAYFGQVSAIESALAGQVTFGALTSAGSDPGACVETVVFSNVDAAKAVAGSVGLGSGWRGAEAAPGSSPQNGNVHQQLVAPPRGEADGESFSAGGTLGMQLVSNVTTSTFSLSLQGETGSVQTWLVDGTPVSCDS
jgi:hypothetical protein